jgi:hypothetical protein
MNKEAKFAIVVAFALLTMSLIGPAHAPPAPPPPQPQMFGHADKSAYLPGDSGNLLVTVKNPTATAFPLKNITVQYSWAQPWTAGGVENYTTAFTNTVAAYGLYSTTISFTVPNDGRVTTIGCCSAQLTGKTNATSFIASIGIGLATPAYLPPTPSQTLTQLWLPIVNIALLVVAVAFLGMLWISMRGTPKKSS